MKCIEPMIVVCGVALLVLGERRPIDEATWYKERYPQEARQYECQRSSLEAVKMVETSYVAQMHGVFEG